MFKIKEINADRYFSDDEDEETNDFRYVNRNATFVHQAAPEFIFYLWQGDDDGFEECIEEMKEAECSSAFINEFEMAHDNGADYLLLYV